MWEYPVDDFMTGPIAFQRSSFAIVHPEEQDEAQY